MIKITLGRKNINDNCGNTEKGSWQFTARTTSKEVKSVQSLKDSLMKTAFGKEREKKSKEIPYRT